MAGHNKADNHKGGGWLWLLALLLIAGGGWLLASEPVPVLLAHWRVAGWADVPAQLEELAIDSHKWQQPGHGSRTGYRLVGRYRYQFAGNSYVSEQIGYSKGRDSQLAYYQQQLARLQPYQQSQQPLLIKVNPQQPAEAYLLAELNLVPLLFGGVMGTGLLASGSGLLYLLRRPARQPLSSGQARQIQADERRAHWGSLLFGVAFLIITSPVLLVVIPAWQAGQWLPLLLLLFPLCGLMALRQAWQQWRNWRYHGPLPLQLDSLPLWQGGNLSGQLPLATAGDYQLSLQCIRRYYSGRGKQRRRHEQLVWQQQQTVALSQGERFLRLHWSLPTALPPSQPWGDDFHQWQLQLQGGSARWPLLRTYPLQIDTELAAPATKPTP